MKITPKQSTNNPPKFTSLAKGKDKILWGYFGMCDEYLIILSIIKDFLQVYAPEISVTIGCKENLFVKGISEEEFRLAGENWIQKIEFKTSPTKPHPLETYLSWLPVKISSVKPKNGKGLIITEYKPSARKLSPEQIKQSERFLAKFNLVPVLSENPNFSEITEAQAVAGIESPAIWHAIKHGKPTAVPEYSVGLGLITKLGGKMLE